MSRGVGNRIITEIDRPSRELVEQFRGIPSSNINDMMNRLFCMHEYIRPLNKQPLLGTAVTVRAPMGDNLFFHKALDVAQPGDVIVVDGGSAMNRSLAGEIMFTYAWKKGIAGIVVDGCVRDLDGIEDIGIPIYAKGVTPQGPYKNGPGEINFPIACGGQVINPGDILVGDADGIVVIKPEDAEEILELAKHKLEVETKKLEKYHTVGLDTEKHIERIETSLSKKSVVYY